MMVHTGSISLDCHGHCDIQDITGELRRVVGESGIGTGLVCVANPGSTGGLTTIEFEPGAVEDLKRALERLAPESGTYAHDAAWGDGNGFAHLRSALVGASLCLPVDNGEPVLGTWQQVVFLDFDNRARRRRLAVVVTGEPR